MKMREIVEVTQEEAALVREANEIEARLYAADKAMREQRIKDGKSAGQEPVLFYSTPRDADILLARDELAMRYKQERGLQSIPILIPPSQASIYQAQITAQPPFRYHQYRRPDQLTDSPSDLEERLLSRIQIRRRGETLFAWTKTYFSRMTENEMKGLIADELREELRHGNAPAQINGILSLLQTDRRIVGVEEENPRYLAVENGVVDWEHLQFEHANPNIFQTNYRNVTWGGPRECPAFQHFLEFISAGDMELFVRLLEVVGFLLSPDCRAKKFVLFQGVGNSGKSVLGSLIQSFYINGDVSSLSVHQFSERFALSAIADRSLNISMDLPNGVLDGRAVAVIKQITGRDTLSIEAKNRQPYSDRIRCKLLFGTNHPVELKVRDEAMAQRILLIPFRVPVPAHMMDPDLLEKLRREKPGIFYHCLAAYREVVRRNYHFTGEERFGFKSQEIVLPAQPVDTVRSFAQQCCQPEPNSFLSTEQLHQAYEAFCGQKGLPGIADRAAFSRALHASLGEQIEQTKRRVGGVPLNGYIGIKFQNGEN